MVLVYKCVGILVGTVTFVSALLFGASFWFSLLLYSVAGSIGVMTVALMQLTIGQRSSLAP